jgi:hypothetical protein
MIGNRIVQSARLGVVTAVAAISTLLIGATQPFADLVNHFGISSGVAASIISLITSGSFLLDFLFPYIIPVLSTVEALIAAFGTGFAAAW